MQALRLCVVLVTVILIVSVLRATGHVDRVDSMCGSCMCGACLGVPWHLLRRCAPGCYCHLRYLQSLLLPCTPCLKVYTCRPCWRRVGERTL
jgi:hypothetical protein